MSSEYISWSNFEVILAVRRTHLRAKNHILSELYLRLLTSKLLAS